jgi:hypothetical protein
MRTKFMTTITLTALLLAGSALATDRSGEFALGFNNSDAPVGLRYFFAENVGADLGLGFESIDLGADSGSSFWLELGVPYVLYDYESSFFFVRPSVSFASLNDGVYGSGDVDESWSVVSLRLNLGAEVRLAERFGLTFQHGLGLTSTSPPGDADSTTNFGTFGENATEAGVWFTF